MQKYRKWTDDATGINPFIQAKKSKKSIVQTIIGVVIGLIKIMLFLNLIPSIVFALILQNFISNRILNSVLHVFPYGLVNLILGFSCDDENYKNALNKNTNKGKLILANSSSIADAFYFLGRLNSVRFIISTPNQENFTILKGPLLLLRVLTNRQPFFNRNNEGLDLSETIKLQMDSGNDVVLFYEGIKTNGLGTIKISKVLSEQLFQLESNYLLTHIKYTASDNNVFSMINHPLWVMWALFRTIKTNIKVRSRLQVISSIHSAGQLRSQLDSFLVANGAKLLDTNPTDYYQFYEFYTKTHELQYK